jgi:hypothetical protein
LRSEDKRKRERRSTTHTSRYNMIFSHFNIFARLGDEVQEVSLFFVGRVGEEYDLCVEIRGGWECEKEGKKEGERGGSREGEKKGEKESGKGG